MTIERPVAFWRIVSPAGQRVALVPSQLAPTEPDAERLLGKQLGLDRAAGWRVEPVLGDRDG